MTLTSMSTFYWKPTICSQAWCSWEIPSGYSSSQFDFHHFIGSLLASCPVEVAPLILPCGFRSCLLRSCLPICRHPDYGYFLLSAMSSPDCHPEKHILHSSYRTRLPPQFSQSPYYCFDLLIYFHIQPASSSTILWFLGIPCVLSLLFSVLISQYSVSSPTLDFCLSKFSPDSTIMSAFLFMSCN